MSWRDRCIRETGTQEDTVVRQGSCMGSRSIRSSVFDQVLLRADGAPDPSTTTGGGCLFCGVVDAVPTLWLVGRGRGVGMFGTPCGLDPPTLPLYPSWADLWQIFQFLNRHSWVKKEEPDSRPPTAGRRRSFSSRQPSPLRPAVSFGVRWSTSP